MSALRNLLPVEFQDKEYAHSYMEGHVVSRIASQVYALRRQRGWSQEQLAEFSGLAQERLSKIENADFDSLTMKTLHKLARAFDVNLRIEYDTFSSGIKDVIDLCKERLEVESRPDDLLAMLTGVVFKEESISNALYFGSNSFKGVTVAMLSNPVPTLPSPVHDSWKNALAYTSTINFIEEQIPELPKYVHGS